MDVLKDVSNVGKQIMLSQPFYGLFLSTLNKVIDNRCPTAGVCKKGINTQLAVNEEFWEKQLPNVRYGVLLHELKVVAPYMVTYM